MERYHSLLDSLKKSDGITAEEYDACIKKNAVVINRNETPTIEIQRLPSTVQTVFEELESKYGINIRELIKDVEHGYSIDITTTVDPAEVKIMQAAVNRGLKHRGAEVGFVVIDANRKIKGILGGRNKNRRETFNVATQTRGQMGSVMKPLVYAIAYDANIVTPRFIETDSTEGLADPPRNWDNTYGRVMTLEDALFSSNNIITRRVWDRIRKELSFEDRLAYITKLGLNTAEFRAAGPNDTTVALGSRSATPLEIATAYATLLDGIYIEPTVIEKLQVGGKYLERKRTTRPVFRRMSVYGVIQSLVKAGDELTGRLDVGIKTGTTNGFKETWVAGFIDGQVTEARSFALLVTNEDRTSLGEGAYASVIARPVIYRWLRSELKGKIKGSKKVYASSEDTSDSAYVSPVQLDLTPPVVDEGLNETADNKVIGTDDAASINGGIEEVIEEDKLCRDYTETSINNTLGEDNISKLYGLRKDMVECSTVNTTEGDSDWAFYILKSAEASDRLSALYLTKEGTESETAVSHYRNAREDYQAVINGPAYTESIPEARRRLEELEKRYAEDTTEPEEETTEE